MKKDYDNAFGSRVGQIEAVMSSFDDACSISVERRDGVIVYTQARRDGDTLELEAIGNVFLPSTKQLDEPALARMEELGWLRPQGSDEPNFFRCSATDPTTLTALAVALDNTFLEVYGVGQEDAWSVFPPELGSADAAAVAGPAQLPLPGIDSDAAGAVDLDQSTRHDSSRPAPPRSSAEVVQDRTSDWTPARFTDAVQEKIGWYVYLLRDPRDDSVFYIGKGRGNRAFTHLHEAMDPRREAEDGLKFRRIRAIHAAGFAVRTEILRHAIPSEAQAYLVEAAVMDMCRALGHEDLANLVQGHHTEKLGWMGSDDVQSTYDAPPIPEFEEPVLMFKIARLWTPAMSASELFQATRGWWVLGPRAAHARHVLAVSRGVTRAAYRVDYWRERVEGDRSWDPDETPPRLGFWGEEAPELAHLVGKSTGHLRQGSGAVVIHANIPASAKSAYPIYRGSDAVSRAAEERHLGHGRSVGR